MSAFGRLLRKLRTNANKSMGEVARYLEVSVVYVSDVEHGRRAPLVPEKIVKVAEFLETDPSPLLRAAAEVRGAFELPADKTMSSTALEVGASLMRAWSSLEQGQLEAIAEVLRVKAKEG